MKFKKGILNLCKQTEKTLATDVHRFSQIERAATNFTNGHESKSETHFHHRDTKVTKKSK